MTFAKAAPSVLALLLLLPIVAQARDEQADFQCPSGGVVGQKCKDVTNGYTTNGHCTHINVCDADSYPKSPNTSATSSPNSVSNSAGAVGGSNASSGSSAGTQNTNGGYSPNQVQNAVGSVPINNGAILVSAFSNGGSAYGSAITDANPQTIVGSETSLDGIQYLITSDQEKLQVGSPLTYETKPQSIGLYSGSIFMLAPAREGASNGSSNTHLYPAYTSDSNFAQPRDNQNGSSNSIYALFEKIVALIKGLVVRSGS